MIESFKYAIHKSLNNITTIIFAKDLGELIGFYIIQSEMLSQDFVVMIH